MSERQPELLQAIAQVVAAFNELGIDYLIGGSASAICLAKLRARQVFRNHFRGPGTSVVGNPVMLPAKAGAPDV